MMSCIEHYDPKHFLVLIGSNNLFSCNYCRGGLKMKKYHYNIDKLFEIVINRRGKTNDTKIIIGRAGKGIARRPWHELKNVNTVIMFHIGQ